MTTLEPRGPYTPRELEQLYPKDLQLQLVQVLIRHGERSPVSSRFRNAGLPPYWPYCNSARQLTSVIMTTKDWSQWNDLKYRRRLETFGSDDGPVVAAGPKGEYDAICQPGELTDKGRETTLALGERLRHLYVDQLGFMPKLISDADMIYLRATPISRALESVQQTFWGMYPPTARTASFPPPTILTRTPGDETLYPNDGNCRRLAQLSRDFAERTAQRWNHTPEMDYLNRQISQWMPPNSPRVAVDSHPRLSGIMDTVNSTLAHGPETRLPSAFYDARFRAIVDKISVEEWYAGYQESREYRALGIGALVGDIVGRMVGSVERSGRDGVDEVGGENGEIGRGRGGEQNLKLALAGCHDTTLAGFLASLGAFEGEDWPPYTSHIAIELFRNRDAKQPPQKNARTSLASNRWFSALFGHAKEAVVNDAGGIARKSMDRLSEAEREKLDGYFVRLRYNDRPMTVPGCKLPGKHLEGDESFCTLEAFKSIADKYVPKHWKQECVSNLDRPAFPPSPEPAGFE